MKRLILVAVLMIAVALGVSAQSVGGGLSFWVPESLYLQRGGTVGVESGLSTSVSMGEMISVPIGIAYNKVYGLLPEGDAAGTAPAPWFIADTMILTLGVQADIGLGPVFFQLFGGGAGGWNMSLTPLVSNIETDIAADGEIATFDGTPSVTDGRFGYGWYAGGAVGMNFGQISVDVSVTYREVKFPFSVSGDYFAIEETNGSFIAARTLNETGLSARLAGLSVGLGGSFAFCFRRVIPPRDSLVERRTTETLGEGTPRTAAQGPRLQRAPDQGRRPRRLQRVRVMQETFQW